MSDEPVLVPSPAGAAPGVADVSAGTLLRQAREATGLHVAALAVAMKVPVKKLEALEADRFQDLPDAVFVRALAASVCRTLKIDPAPVLGKLPLSAVPKLDAQERGLNTPVSGPSFMVTPSLKAFAGKPSVLLVGLILLAALAVVFIPETRNTVSLSPAAPVAADVAPAAPAPAPVPAAEAVVAPTPVATAVPAASPQPAAPAPATPAVAVAPVATPAPATPASAAVAPAEAAPVSGLLVFKASAPSWVRVSDSKGAVLFEKTLAAGESAAASGAVPLSVVVGNVAGTQVLLRGQPFQMVDMNQNNVARFEVK